MDSSKPYRTTFSEGPKTALPNASAVLALGISSIVGCLCYGIVGVICAIIAIVLSNKDLALYRATPGQYTVSSYNNLKTGRTCAIIGLSMSAILLVAVIILIITLGTVVITDPSFLQDMQRSR